MNLLNSRMAMDENLSLFERANGRYDAKDIIDLLVILTKWRRFIVVNCLIVTIVAVIVSLFLPKWYAATASVLPPVKKDGLFGQTLGVSKVLQDYSKTLGRLGSAPEETYNYLAILKSRTAMEKVIREFNLRQVYEIAENAPMERVLAALEANVDFAVHEEETLTIIVYDKSPLRAADMANYFVKILNDISIDLNTREAKSNREFIEKRYQQVQADLRVAENTLKKFQEKYGVFAISEQTKAVVNTAAELKSQILVKEIGIGVLQRTLGDGAVEVQRARLELSELNRKLAEMKYGNAKRQDENSLQLFVPFKDIPDVGMEHSRLYRDFEMLDKLIAFLSPIYEKAKIDEQKTIPVVLVLDKAVPAERKAKPRRSLFVLFCAGFSLFLSITFALWYEAFQRVKADPERYQKFQQGVISPLRNSLRIFVKEK